MKLYEIANEYQAIFTQLEDLQDGTNESDVLAQRLDAIQAPLENKAVNVAKYVSHLRATSQAIAEEIDRLKKMQRAVDRREEDIQQYLSFNMQRCGIDKIESPLYKIQFKKCPPKVEILDESEVPDEYKRTKTEIVVDKIKLRDEMKNGVVIPGAVLMQNMRLEIR